MSGWSDDADTCEALRRHRGVGRALLNELLRRGAGLDVYLTTISRQAGFYMRQGFTEVPLSPAAVPRRATRRGYCNTASACPSRNRMTVIF